MQPKIKFIGVAGTAGSGKNSVAELLTKLFGLRDLNTSDMGRAITRQVYHLPPDFNPVRDQLYIVANYVRNEIHPAGYVKLCMLEAQALNLSGGVISGLRSMGEADAIREAGGIIIGVDADPKIRYDRIYARARDTESQKTYEEFLKQDEYENRGISDTGPGRGIRAIIDSADLVIKNDGSLEALERELQEKVAPFLR
ncbi:MAG TPA: AAA family ATPase [Candidatus Saccharimonadales bacterium]